MNDYCKEYLAHSWGTSPERKKLETEYNAKYYSQNKERWKINKLKRLSGISPRNSRLTGNVEEIYLAPTSLYDDGEFYKYSTETFNATTSAIGKALNKLKDVPKKVVTAIKKALKKTVVDLPKAVINTGKSVFDAFKDNKVYQIIKQSSDTHKRKYGKK